MEINNMMQLHGSGKMEEEAWTWGVHMCGSIAMHSMEMNCQE